MLFSELKYNEKTMTWKLLWTDGSANISLRKKEPQKYRTGGGQYFKQKKKKTQKTAGA